MYLCFFKCLLWVFCSALSCNPDTITSRLSSSVSKADTFSTRHTLRASSGEGYARVAQKIQARTRDEDFDARLGLERGGERSVFSYVTEPTSRAIRRIAQKIQARLFYDFTIALTKCASCVCLVCIEVNCCCEVGVYSDYNVVKNGGSVV